MAIIAQVRAFEHINFNKNCGVDEFTEDFLASDAAMNPETESGRFACAKRPYGRGRRTRTLNKGFGDPRVTITPCPYASARTVSRQQGILYRDLRRLSRKICAPARKRASEAEKARRALFPSRFSCQARRSSHARSSAVRAMSNAAILASRCRCLVALMAGRMPNSSVRT